MIQIRGISYWQDVRRHFRTPGVEQAGFLVPKHNILQTANLNEQFQDFAVSDEQLLDLDDVLAHLFQTKSNNASFPLSFFDLFCNGLTNICRSIYFSMDVAMTVAEVKLEKNGSQSVAGKGEAEH